MPTNPNVKIITSEPFTVLQYLQELNKHKTLIWVFAMQEIKTAYVQTYLGIGWAVVRPLIILGIFTLLFKTLLKIHTDSPYYLFAFSGMIAWNFFSNLVNNASSAIVQKQQLIRKMYFPKLILPLSKILVSGVETGVSILIVFLMLLIEGIPFHWNMLLLPFFLFLNICCGFCIAVWMNALNISFRDLNQIVPPLIGMGIWFTPVFFPTTIIPPAYQFVLWFNPMAGVVKGFRYSLLGEQFPEWQFFVGFGVIVILTLIGIWYLTQVEDELVDYA